jgi:hypothetical protein
MKYSSEATKLQRKIEKKKSFNLSKWKNLKINIIRSKY